MGSWRECPRPSSKRLAGALGLGVICLAGLAGRSAAAGQPEHGCPELYVMVNKDNPVESLSLDEIRTIYAGQKTRWPSGGKIIVIAAPDDSRRAEVFNRQVLGGSRRPRTLGDSPIPFRPLLLSRRGAREYVRLFRNAIAYGWRNSLVTDVKWISVPGLNPPAPQRCRPRQAGEGKPRER